MKERPILFSALMVRALLDGSKTQTRRVVKPHPSDDAFALLDHGDGWWPYRSEDGESANVDNMEYPFACPYGRPGEHLWVRETWVCDHFQVQSGPYLEASGAREHLFYRADNEHPFEAPEGKFWKPSIHMPRWASRILLDVVSVRVEQLSGISEADARAEGVTIEDRHKMGYCAGESLPPSVRAYRELWESINGAGSWAANPWVWVVEFKRVAP
jgi:hypothetical protein